ncbi:ABC-type multidrug transport system, ATPase component [Fontibacillus panacisegetis]|uniref:ABC-type multidrug transport system, ATPase component n=1 Tax=Fontibacillus panacisegetis TaxID=670482 RepID=A0A1G7H6W0_9BACL|nr:ABC transporter ATP-binding protein [Fontibacillus panacisegetis]SDE96172.1 ABC-type multidrug transport system, ATPase component [Fontibacillus panacisegetis]
MITIDGLHQPQGDFSLKVNRLRISQGLTLLVGANGAGKSTLLELLATIQMPAQGSILYRQRYASGHLPLLRSQIGYVPSEIELYEEMTAYKLLCYLAELKGVYRKEQVEGIMREFRLEPYRKVKIKSLSQGICRRIAIAQALLANPYYLFLDEPLNAMDISERKLTITFLTRYAIGRTVVAAVHELNEWEAAADDVLWLDRGRIAFSGDRGQWTEDLPCRVWEGPVTNDQFTSCSEKTLILFRELPDEGMFVRIISDKRPFQSMSEADPTMEDAYFVRKYNLKGSI